ncbi:MAG: hypothetical protein WCP35_00975 [Verrucomicrobiota bacterium]
MKLPIIPTHLGICAGLLAALPLQAGIFAPPLDGPLVFRRDRLPLDVDTMRGLSNHLCSLAQAQGGENPVQRRCAAQLLALALALQPGNLDARRLLETFTKEDPKPGGDVSQLDVARSQVWRLLGWLETAEAGADANALAACLGDVMTHVEPQLPRAEELRKRGEQGAWSGWVEPLAAFSKAEPVVNNTPPLPIRSRLPETPAAAKSPILLATAVVTTPLWTLDKTTGATVMRALPIRMTAKLKDGYARSEPLTCSLDFQRATGASDWSPFKSTSAVLVTALAKDFGKLPTGVAVGLACGENADYLMERNGGAISAAAAVLMNAAITGNEPNAIVIGEVQTDGSLTLPKQFWEKLRCLTDGPGGRLVLPTEAEKYLPSILALEQPGFFLKYEILLAANLHELISRSSKSQSPEFTKLSTNFCEVRSKLGNQRITEYLANRFVRLRLEEISREASFHASARMLVIQGSGKRPTTLPRNTLADELRRFLRPMAWITSHPVETLQTKAVNDTYEMCLRDVEHMERYVELHDHELYTQVHNLVSDIRVLSRATRGRSVDSKTFLVPWRSEFTVFCRSYQRVNGLLNQASADG